MAKKKMAGEEPKMTAKKLAEKKAEKATEPVTVGEVEAEPAAQLASAKDMLEMAIGRLSSETQAMKDLFETPNSRVNMLHDKAARGLAVSDSDNYLMELCNECAGAADILNMIRMKLTQTSE